MKLKLKITAGFLIIAAMLFIAGAWSIFQVKFAGKNLRKMFGENLSMIYETNKLNRALEIEQKAFMLFLLDKKEESVALFNKADSIFGSTLKKIETNISNSQEKRIIEQIKKEYASAKNLTDKLLSDKQIYSKEVYFSKLKTVLEKADKVVDEFHKYYETRLSELTMKIDAEENRSIMPGLVAMSAAIVFALLFSFFVNHYVVTPIVTITKKVNDFTENGIPYDYQTESKDEIHELSESVRKLTVKAEINRD